MRAAARTLKAAGVQAVAVSFLYGFIRPDHEKRAVAILREEMPDAFISAGHEIAPEFREFERLSTVVLNAYLGPVMGSYIRRLSPRLEALGMTATPHLTQSNGGVIGFATAADMPVRTILSGPSTGVVGAQAIGAAGGLRRPHHLRHGRHLDRRRPAAGRPLRPRRRSHRARLSDQGADARHPHRRRRRRLDRLYRQRRAAEGGAALRRRRSRPGLLRPRQRGAHRHRRQRRAADAEPRAPAGRPHEDPPAISPSAAVGRLAERLGLGIDGNRAGHPLGRDRQHGARDPRDLRAARPRSARLHADGVRRRRAPACGAAGAASSRSAACWCRPIPASCAPWACC